MRQDHLARARAGAAIAALCLGFAAAGCGGDDAAKVEVALEFPSESAANRTATLHLWVVMPNGRDPEVIPTCNMLVSEEITPYDLNLVVKYDGVVTFEGSDVGLTASDVDTGASFVYVEAVDFGGGAHLAGCAEVSLDGGTTEVSLVLRAPGTYDCSDAAVENGEYCDDGDFCTVGEECRDGTCVNGVDRDCSALQDVCNTATCDSGIGCVVEPLPDLTSCSTGDYCVTSAVCMEGVCEGNERDCSDSVPECYAGVCNEDSNSCDQVPISEADCDDEDDCTGDDTCTTGVCDGTPLTSGACDDEDPCTVNTTCNGGGAGAGGGGGGGNLVAD
ncbi:MAG TPA: hypothetical protein VMZ28_04555, partial [Kofleriaceae bacterium]|nr:hypothetical protein [Kofleriaceae bacterium]